MDAEPCGVTFEEDGIVISCQEPSGHRGEHRGWCRSPLAYGVRWPQAGDDGEQSVHETVAGALERELVEFTGQTHWERSKIDAAAQRIVLALSRVETQISRIVRNALEDGEHGD